MIDVLEGVQARFNERQRGNKRVSLADVIVLGGAAAIEKAAAAAGYPIEVPFVPGRRLLAPRPRIEPLEASRASEAGSRAGCGGTLRRRNFVLKGSTDP